MSEMYADAERRYRLDSRIATGGMGVVWRATDTVLGRLVAVKVLKPEYADDALFRTRFETEAQHAAALHHPGVAQVFDYGEGPSDDGGGLRPFLVMELVEGQPLSALLRPGQPMPPEAARDLIARTADAIAAAHAKGIVHRDVKPANLLVTPDRNVKITDFGIARAAEGMALTQTGQVIGTPQYLSPEQAEGKTATPASDVYSLGVERPVTGTSPVTVAMAHLHSPVPELPDFVPTDLAIVVRRALAKSPDHRFQNAAAFAAALRAPKGAGALTELDEPTAVIGAAPDLPADATQVMAGAPTGPDTTVPTEPDATRRRGRRWVWALALPLVLVLLGWYAFSLVGADSDPPTTPTTGETRTSEPSATTEATPTEASHEGIEVDEDDYIGRDFGDVRGELKDLGLAVEPVQLENPGDEEERTVEGIDPSGVLEEGDTVRVSYWGKAPKEESSDEPSEFPTESASPTDSPTEIITDGPGNSDGDSDGDGSGNGRGND